mgnify:CR=1 FL=1
MPINSKQKGKRGELEWVHRLKGEGYEAERTVQYKGSLESFDVESNCPIKRYEVKRVQNLNVYAVMDKSRQEAQGEAFALAWRKDGGKWVVVMDDWVFFKLMEAKDNGDI